MATVRQFEELKIWQEARDIVRTVYSLTRKSAFAKDYGLKDQIQRAAVSIGSNIAEGFERDSNSEFLKFLAYAKGSAGEVRSQLYTARDLSYLTEDEFSELYAKLLAEAKMIARFQTSLRTSPIKGRYYKPETRNHQLET